MALRSSHGGPPAAPSPRTSTSTWRGDPRIGGEAEGRLTEKSYLMAAHPAPSQSRAGIWCMARAWKRNTGASHTSIPKCLPRFALQQVPVMHPQGGKIVPYPRFWESGGSLEFGCSYIAGASSEQHISSFTLEYCRLQSPPFPLLQHP